MALSRTYPKPSPLPDLHLVTEAIAWDDSWADMENKVQKILRYIVQRFSGHMHLSITTKGGRYSIRGVKKEIDNCMIS